MTSFSGFALRLISKTDRLRLRIMDRIYADTWPARFGMCGEDVGIRYPCTITAPHHAKLGNNVRINRGAYIRAEGGLTIGDNTHIARNVTIYTINHDYRGDALPYDEGLIKKPVVIGENVWIGINVTIVPGASIGDGAIIGAGSVVAMDVPPLAIVGSAPLRILKYRDREHYEHLKAANRFGGEDGKLYRKAAKA
ncbi:MAG: acyltransferase [Litorilinea sp.]